MTEKSYCLVFLSFYFSDCFSFFSSFPPFSISSLSFFLLFNPNQDSFFHCFFFYSIIFSLDHVFLFVILFFLLLSLCLVLFNSFRIVFSNFLFHSFETLFRCEYRSLFHFTSSYSAFSIAPSCYFVFMPPTRRVPETLCFRVVRPSVRTRILLTRNLKNPWVDFFFIILGPEVHHDE